MRVITRMSTQAKWQTPSPFGPCVCSQLRRTARKVSVLYDRSLAAAGLTVTQHALLVNIARAGKISRSALAVQLGMDRTTLTRDLKPLEKASLVAAAKSSDGRERLLRLSPEGHRRLQQSYQRWEETQKEFTAKIGQTGLKDLRNSLSALEIAAEKCIS
jgi:DNA-binding MarR family transcriptional regulator